ncbi:ABC-type transport auxiliary lipoprotein family protein [Niveibacterium microcysteis]|uniref:ABC-type transport auxiliary lipoprotein component domain-containing protein n=1 Tax=Niveibacterium microcysteis TaxID=2811415 RepID=A0ABX7M3R1_9RHOO|nr:hypothetical protein [Niveibacterium microcysteis]QSI75070.1 hypothetical protein JY500_11050 [Niveibacterium microcysteis]
MKILTMRKFLGFVFPVLALAACTSLPAETGPSAVHDLGLPVLAGSAPSPLPLRRVEVLGNAALGGLAMQYRYAEDQTTRRLNYADNRWSATPAQLLEGVVSRMLSGPTQPSRCKLTLRLDEFVQVFARDGSSAGYIAGSFLLIGERADEVLAQTPFEARLAAPSADASGGAQALRGASEMVGRQAARWLATQDARRCTAG